MPHPKYGHPPAKGFTLIELILVIVLLGVLSVYAAPRVFGNVDFYARGFHDESLALLRYAQKTAIAQRRMVCVTLSTTSVPNNIVLTMENPVPVTTPLPAVACTINVTGPRGDQPGRVEARTGVSLSGTSFIFDALGQPVNSARAALAASQTLQVAAGGVAISKMITVESVTGYVHD